MWGLTFELRGRRRCGAWPARRMMDHNASRAKCHAGWRSRSSEGLGLTQSLLERISHFFDDLTFPRAGGLHPRAPRRA